MPKVLSLKPTQTDKTGWHPRDAGSYDAEYANAIEEPAGTEPQKMLQAIPSPFARLHVFDVAFGFLSEPSRDRGGDSVFHQVVSQGLDALELMFNWNTHLASRFPLQVMRWDAEGELSLLCNGSAHEEHRLLAEALALYFDRDRALEAAKRNTWMLLANDGTPAPLAVSSPLTLVAPTPNAAAIAARLQLKVPGEGRVYFTETRSLVQRSPAFQVYLESLFAGDLKRHCVRLFKYIERVRKGTTDFSERRKYEAASYTEIIDNGSPIEMHGETMRCAVAEPVPANILASKRRLKPDRAGVDHAPIVLVDGVDSVGATRATFRAPAVGSSRVDLQACKLEYSIVSPK